MLKHEKESLGFYITGHPLTKYDKLLKRMGTKRLSELDEVPDDSEVKIGGIVTAVKKIQTKAKAEMMAYCTIEDPEGHVDVIVFPELYRNSLSLLQKDTPVLIKGTVDKTEKGIKIVSTEISGLDSLEDRIGHKVEVNLTLPLSGPSSLQDLRSVILDDSKGKFPLFLRITHKNAETLIATGMKISYENEVIRKIEEITGKGAVVFQ
jgi:DNA polymerase-3 subunit alpha